jgi:secondary thiamine-phosphate synthase enzyme
MIVTEKIRLSTRGNCDIHNITRQVSDAVIRSGLKAGTVTVFVPGSTAGVTTLEYEPGLISDVQELFDRLVPTTIEYRHNRGWGEGNGHSHVRASLLGPSITVPFTKGRLTLGTWQQLIFLDFDNRPRNREIVLQIIGE